MTKLERPLGVVDAVAKYSRENPNVAIAAALIRGQQIESAYVHCDASSRFEIGSITKVLTAILLSEAVAEGCCRLDDPLDQWLPQGRIGVASHRYLGRQITLRSLATHTSSLPRLPLRMFLRDVRSAQPYAKWDRNLLIEAIAKARIDRIPGSTYSYSNFGFAALGLALETMRGKPYEALISDLTARLGCPEIRLPVPGDEGRLAKGTAVEPWKMAAFAPAGGATSTLDALVAFAQINLAELSPRLAPVRDGSGFIAKSTWPALSMALNERREYATHPPVGSGLIRSSAMAIAAGGISHAFPGVSVLPLICLELATFAGGFAGGGIAALGWEAGVLSNHSTVQTQWQTLGLSAIGILLSWYIANQKPGQTMGLGWHVTVRKGQEAIWHNGGTAGFRSFMGLYPASNSAVVVLAAHTKPAEHLAAQILT